MSSPEVKPEIRLEIGHVLFIDIVAYSKLLTSEQSEQLQKLKEIVWGTEQFRLAQAEGKLLRLPTGDGGALVFRNHPEAPVLCAIEISKELKRHPELQVRMGIHSGPVNEITDLNAQANIAGAGINIAQRVMDCGDAGHILLSQHVAEDLEQSPRWRSQLHDIGTFEAKHGVRVNIANLYSDEFGNPRLPSKLQAAKKHRAHVRWAAVAAALLLLGAIVGGGFYFAGPSAIAADNDSIAVLPFVNMSDDKGNEYFSDGISEELLNLLSKIPQLKVAARTSSFSFKGKGVEIPEIARQLHVANVLEGSVRKSGDELRITAQLIRAAEGYHLWSETYDRKMDDIFKIQDEIAGEVVKQLKVKLLGAAPKVRTTDPKAYALYLQGKELGRQHTPETFAKSDKLFRQAAEIDPFYAPAWDALAANFANKAYFGLMPMEEGFARSREADEKALAVDPDYAPAHSGLGWIAVYRDDDLVSAARHYQRALESDPTDLRVLSEVSWFLQIIGRLDEALVLNEALVRRDPVNVDMLGRLAFNQRAVGRYDDSIASFRTVLNLSPDRGAMHFALGVSLLLKGDATAALAEIEQEKIEGFRTIGLPMAYCALGRKADADAAFKTLIVNAEKDTPYNIAYVYAFCGNADKAFEWLDKSVANGGAPEILMENLFDKIHSDPRWLPFLRKIGKAPEQLAKIEFKVPPLPQ
jgi:adenylate cyclase